MSSKCKNGSHFIYLFRNLDVISIGTTMIFSGSPLLHGKCREYYFNSIIPSMLKHLGKNSNKSTLFVGVFCEPV